MKVILTTDVEKIGTLGSVVIVKDGYARNFLFPRQLAVPSTQANMKALEAKLQKRTAELQRQKKQAEQLRVKLEALSLTLAVLTHEDEKLYAGISSVDILNALKEEGVVIEKSAVLMDEPIRALGIYEIPVKLHPEVNAKLKIWVVKK
jgi:large subunit ribosomal protein L9